ncbi:MAG: hypothetical protein MUO62_02810, partial [Anaerolineales bacterium]|nr:hypothetical protein [Anaerolineales bacterium]
PRSLLRGFHALAKSVPAGAKFRNTPSACGGDRNFEDFATLFLVGQWNLLTKIEVQIFDL